MAGGELGLFAHSDADGANNVANKVGDAGDDGLEHGGLL